MSSCQALPGMTPKDLSLNNLVVCGNTALASAKIGNLKIGRISDAPVPITPTANFTLDSNASMAIGNIIQVSFSGVVHSTLTNNVATMRVPLATIPANLAPLNPVFGTSCQDPQGILVFRLDSTGLIETCPSGFPFPAPADYPISSNLLYIL